MTELPDRPSELIRLALADLRKAEVDPLYRIDMSQWHTPAWLGHTPPVCHVCMAGAVIAMTLGMEPFKHLTPGSVPEPTGPKLSAINQFRMGEIDSGLTEMGIDEYPEDVPSYMPVPHYSASPEKFHARMEEIAAMLERYGL